MKNNIRYIQFPLYLIRELFLNKKNTINEILTIGLYRFSKQVEYDLIDVAKQIITDYIQDNDKITLALNAYLDNYINNGTIHIKKQSGKRKSIEIYNKKEIDNTIKIFRNDENFKNIAIEYYQISEASNYLKISGNFDIISQRAKIIDDNTPKGEPCPMVNISLLFDFMNNEKSEFELAQLAGYIALRSILGQKKYCKTNKKMIASRMFGYSSVKHVPKILNEDIDVLYKKYLKRYHIDNVIQHLELSWNVLTYSNNIRGMYIGIKYNMSIEELVVLAEKNKKKNQIAAHKAKKGEAIQKTLKMLHNIQQD